jgi:hypothetical protein
MGLTIYGPDARAIEGEIEACEWIDGEEIDEDDELLDFEAEGDPEKCGVYVGDEFGPIVWCESVGCHSRVRFDWRHERQLCELCGGPPVVHAPTCDVVAYGVDWQCDCGAR